LAAPPDDAVLDDELDGLDEPEESDEEEDDDEDDDESEPLFDARLSVR
jgi:hypothetical protein